LKEEDFDKEIRNRIQSYRAVAAEVQDQRALLSFAVNCELVKGIGAAAVPFVAGSAASGVLTQTQTAMGAGTLLLACCLWAVDRIQDLKPASDALRSAEAEFEDNICFGMHNFFRRLATSVGRRLDE
jgi:hypothetical protein